MASDEVAITKPVKEAPRVGAISLSDETRNVYSVNWKFGSWATDSSNAGRLNYVDCIWEMLFDKFNPEVKNQNYDTCKGLPVYGDYTWTSHNTSVEQRPWGTRKLWVGCQPDVEEDEFMLHIERMFPFADRVKKNNEWYIDWDNSLTTAKKNPAFMKLLSLQTRVYGTNPKTGGQMNRGPGGYSTKWYFSPPDPPTVSQPQMLETSAFTSTVAFTTTAGRNQIRYVPTSGQPTSDTKAVKNDGGKNVGLIYEKKRYATRYSVYRKSKLYNTTTGKFDLTSEAKIAKDTDVRREFDVSAIPGGPSGYRAVNGLCTDDENTITVSGALTYASDSGKFRYGSWIDIKVKAYDVGCGGSSSVVVSTHRFCYPYRVPITSINVDNPNSPNEIYVKIERSGFRILPADTIILERVSNSTAATVSDLSGASWTTVYTFSMDQGAQEKNLWPLGFVDHFSDTGQTTRGTHCWYRVRTVRDGVWTTNGVPVEAEVLYRPPISATGSTMAIVSAAAKDSSSVELVLGWPNETDPLTGTEISWSEYEDAWYSTSQPTTFNETWKDDTSQATGYANSAKVVLRGLSEGTPYFIKARRYHESSEGGTTYGKYAFPPAASYPIAPVSAPENVVLSAPEYWPKGTPFEVLWTYESDSEQTEWILNKKVGTNVVQASASSTGNDATGATTYEPADDEESVTLQVSMTTGSAWATSNEATVTLASPPVCTVDMDDTVTAQPMTFSITTTTPNCSVYAVVLSEGYFYRGPDGDFSVSQGETVWSYYSDTQVWDEDEGEYTTGVTADIIDRLYDMGSYILIVRITDPVTGLSSESAQKSFSVSWTHKAVLAGLETWVQTYPDDKTVTIHLVAGEGAAETDAADVFRVTPDGYYKLAEGVPFGSDVTDRFAPYSNYSDLEYRVQTRTVDGDTDWVDIPYHMYGYAIRFDWGSESSLELPYNLKFNDAFTKDSEIRKHMDGGNGLYLNRGVDRSMTISSQTVKESDPEQYERLRSMAHYEGPVFVRTPDGCAFPANVDVDGIDKSYDSLVSDISIRATEVAMTAAFSASEEDITTPSS